MNSEAMFQQPADFRDECDALCRLLEPLTDRDFERPTQFKDYTIHDVVAHLHVFNGLADLSLRDEAGFHAFNNQLRDGLKRGRSLKQLTDDHLEGARNRAAFEQWRDYYPEMAEHFAAADPKQRVPWAGKSMSVRSSITARLMETWAHGQEVYDELGVERVDADRIENIAVLGVNTFGFAFANRGIEIPERTPRVRLTAPSGALWEWNSEVESDLVEGHATEFCQVVTQVRSLADTKLRVEGEVAKRWMSIAQCFAGPASEPPQLGSRYTVR